MARRSSDDIFHLIHSMTQSEKRAFKIFSKRHVAVKKVKYAALFDAIAKQKRYDEKKLLEDHPWIDARLFPDRKKRLYRMILRSLSVQFHEQTIDSTIRFLLSCSDLLYDRSLYAQCRKLVAEAARLAQSHGKLLLYLECLSREKNLVFTGFNLKTSPRRIHNLNEETEKCIRVFNNEQAYKKLSEEMFLIQSEETFIRSAKNRLRSRKIISHPLMQSPRKALSLLALYDFHRTYGLYCYSHTDYKGFYHHSREILSLIEKHRAVFSESVKPHIVALQNVAIAQKNLGLFSEVFSTLRKLKRMETPRREVQAQIFAISTDIALTVFIDTGQFRKGAMLAAEVDEGLQKFRSYISLPYELLFSFNLAYNCLGAGLFKRALFYVNRVINHPQAGEALPQVFSMSRLLSLVIHYELGNSDLLDYRLKSTLRWFSKRNTLYELEDSLINFLREALVTPRDKDRLDLYRDLYRRYEKLESDPEKRKAFSSFDFRTWIESKMKNTTMEQVVRERKK